MTFSIALVQVVAQEEEYDPFGITPEMEAEMQRDMSEEVSLLPEHPDDPNLERVGFLRIWYFGTFADAPRVTLAGDAANDDAEPRLLEVNMRPGTMGSDYQAWAPGSFELHVLDAEVRRTENADNKLPLAEKRLVPPHRIQLKPGVYTTLVIQPGDHGFNFAAFEDKPRPREAEALVRVLDFSGMPGWSVRLLDGKGSEREVWSSSRRSSANGLALPGGHDRYHFGIHFEKDGISKMLDVVTTEVADGTTYSLVLHAGRGGWGAAQGTYDATPGAFYNAEIVEILANFQPKEE